jgi:hypothetical protein
MRIAPSIALCALAFSAACKKAEAPDAGRPITSPISDKNVGVDLSFPQSWSVKSGADGGLAEGWVADARRPADPGRPSLVVPRFVVTVEPLIGWSEIDTLLEKTLIGIRKIEEGGAARILRSSKGRRTLGGVEMGELRVDYRVVDPTRSADRDVVQRVWLVQRFGADSKTYVLSLTLTHLAADEELVANELEAVLRSVRFQ